MNFTEIFIRRPVFSIVLSTILVLVGIVGYNRLQLRQFPKIETPKISVTTTLEGASPDIMESQITKILEDRLMGIEGLDVIKSTSELENSRITLEFTGDRKIEDAMNDVREAIARVRNKLPKEISDPQIKKQDADATAFLHLAIYSDRYTPGEIADFVKRYLESQLEAVKGVSSVDTYGGGTLEMHIMLDPVRMASYSITAEDVASALKAQNIEKPAGALISADREFNVTTLAPFKSEEDFRNLIVADRDGYLVRLKDVGDAALKSEDKRNRTRFNDKPAVTIAITKQSIANQLDISKAIEKMLPEFRTSMPKGMFIDIAYDTSIFIEQSLDEIYKTIRDATFLVVIVVLFTLGSLRGTLIPVITIPISLIGTFSFMYFLGFSLNTQTLFALALAVGLVVDDAIVVLENVYRYIEEGFHPVVAAIKGAREISFAVIAMTLTLAAVYAPISLAPGLVGRLFTEFSVTLAVAVLISGFVALTLSPGMCARLLKPKTSHPTEFDAYIKPQNVLVSLFSTIFHYIEKHLDNISFSYSVLLRKSLHKKLYLVLGGVGIAFTGFIISYFFMNQELSPREDRGILNVRAIQPYGASLEYVDQYMKEVDTIMGKVPEIKNRLMLVQTPGESSSLNLLVDWKDRKRSSDAIAESLYDPLNEVIGLQLSASSGGRGFVGGKSQYPINLVIQSTKPQEELIKLGKKVKSIILHYPGIRNLQSDFGVEGQRWVVTPDAEKAKQAGIDVSVIADTLDILISGRIPTYLKFEGERVPVRVEVEDKYRTSPENLSAFFLRGTVGREERMVPLTELVKIEKKTTPTDVSRFNGMRALSFFGDVKPGTNVGEALKNLKTAIQEELPSGARVDFDGESRRLIQEQSNIYFVFIMALLFIYLVLAAQYESFIDPFIIILSVPLSMSGGIIFLKMFGESLNLYSLIGFLTLIGLITKHAILIVDFANKMKLEDGLHKFDAVIEAARMRLRPILMTTFAMVIGAFPFAFASGPGFEARREIGWVIVGGMSLGTLFTLFVVPAVYLYLSKSVAKTFDEAFEDVLEKN